VSDLVATATGTLAKTPLTNLLIYCLDRSLSGTLVLQSPEDVRHAIYFQRGVPAKVRTGDHVALLGRVLVEMGFVTQAVVEDALVAADTLGCPIGEALLEGEKINRTQLLAALKQQTLRKLTNLFLLPETTAYGFYEQRNLLESWGGPELTPVEVLALIMSGVQVNPPKARIEAALVALGDKPLKLHVDGDFRRFQLNDRSRGVVDLLKMKPLTAAQLLNAGVTSESEVRQILYTFLLTRHLDLGGSLVPPVGFAPQDSSSPISESTRAAVGRVKLRNAPRSGGIVEVGPARSQTGTPLSAISVANALAAAQANAPQIVNAPPSAEMEARRREITERAEKIDREDFFAMLGVPRDCPVDVAQSAYFGLAKRWHPDRLPAELSDLRDQAAKVFARLSEAFQTISDKEKRAKYVDLMQQGGGSPEEQEKVNQILEAHMDFQKAEILLKKGDLAGAERLAAKAAAADPEQADYLALLAWLRASQPGASTSVLAESVKTFDSLLGQVPNHHRALWYRGSLLKRLGREELGIVDFRRLLVLDSKNLDAAREVRLYDMRHGGASPPPAKDSDGDDKKSKGKGDKNDKGESKGLFGGLFKK
jgi:tetratricopeptide (TPR) repeat protein